GGSVPPRARRRPGWWSGAGRRCSLGARVRVAGVEGWAGAGRLPPAPAHPSCVGPPICAPCLPVAWLWTAAFHAVTPSPHPQDARASGRLPPVRHATGCDRALLDQGSCGGVSPAPVADVGPCSLVVVGGSAVVVEDGGGPTKVTATEVREAAA